MPSSVFATCSQASIASSRRSKMSFQRMTTSGSMPASNSDAMASRLTRSPSFSRRLTSHRVVRDRRERAQPRHGLGDLARRLQEDVGQALGLLHRRLDLVEAEVVGHLVDEVDDVVEVADELEDVLAVDRRHERRVQPLMDVVGDPVALLLADHDVPRQVGPIGVVGQHLIQQVGTVHHVGGGLLEEIEEHPVLAGEHLGQAGHARRRVAGERDVKGTDVAGCVRLPRVGAFAGSRVASRSGIARGVCRLTRQHASSRAHTPRPALADARPGAVGGGVAGAAAGVGDRAARSAASRAERPAAPGAPWRLRHRRRGAAARGPLVGGGPGLRRGCRPQSRQRGGLVPSMPRTPPTTRASHNDGAPHAAGSRRPRVGAITSSGHWRRPRDSGSTTTQRSTT